MSVLPVNEPVCHVHDGAISLLIEPKPKDLGAFSVRRALPSPERQRIGPFIFFDEMGPAELAVGSGMDVRPHPHIGIATVTYLFAGEVMHRDSLGVAQSILPGAVNWMTAGRGIVHSERSPESLMNVVAPLHGIQTWLALPIDQEETEPAFVHYPAESIPLIEQAGVSIRLIAGSAWGETSPVRTASPTFYAAATLNAGARVVVPADAGERGVYVVKGEVSVGATSLCAGTLAVLADGVDVSVDATSDATIMLFGGEGLSGERTLWWNFVSSRPERIEQAKTDWKNDRFDKVPGETEFIPLPED